MESQLDTENYWNRSAGKAFNFDDDGEANELSSPSGITTNWNADSSLIFNDDTISEASFDNVSTVNMVNYSIKSLVSDDTLQQILQEQTLDERIVSKGMPAEEELKLLRRHIQTTLFNPSPAATAYKLLLGKTTPLEVFKSLQEKQELLDAILHNGGGDAVIGVLLFLRKSLDKTHFNNILQERSKALEHYISYLKQRGQIQEAVELLQLFNKQQEASLLQFATALSINQSASLRKEQLLRLNESYANNRRIVQLHQQIFHAAYKLYELVERERNTLGNQVCYQSTPIEVLYACCQKNSNWKEQDTLCSIAPQRICAEQQISVAQYEWTALNERARAQAYGDLESIFERIPTWLPIKTKQFHINFNLELAIQRLYELQAPPTVLYLFLSKMNNTNEKLALAQRVKCTKAIIDAMAGLKQTQELIQLKHSLPERSEEQFYCENTLKNMQSKRWTTDNIKLKL